MQPVLRIAWLPTVDSIEEFKVQSGTMSAEYGFTLGGIINVVTKSGTNTPHGSVYEFVRNSALDARNTFSVSKTPFTYNQFGGSAGGPVYLPKAYSGRDRTFFFSQYEEFRFRQGSSAIWTVPTQPEYAGDFSDRRDVRGNLIPIYDPATTRANPSGSGSCATLSRATKHLPTESTRCRRTSLRLCLDPNTSFSPGPDGLSRSSAFGTIRSARSSRIVQFGLKLIF